MAAAWLAILAAALAAGDVGRSALFTEAAASAEAPRVQGLPDLSRVAEGALPSVVGIVTLAAPGATAGPAAAEGLKDLFEHFHGDGSARRGLATGFIIHRDGYIVTNAHVVEDAGRVEVDLGDDGDRVPARVVGRDDGSDIALLKVDVGRPLPVLPLGDSDRLHVAEWVIVVGNPFGLSRSVTLGIVSHTDRADVVPGGRDGYYDFIQTDASINPGNSGGPLLNLRGEVVGIATAINATGQGIGFAVPINMAKQILGQLRDSGHLVRSWMGVSVREEHGAGRRGVVVTNVVSGGPAASGGLRVGDVVVGFDGRRVASAARLRWYVATAGVGRAVALTVRRGSAEQAVHVELGEAPGEARAVASTPRDTRPAAEAGSGAAAAGDQ